MSLKQSSDNHTFRLSEADEQQLCEIYVQKKSLLKKTFKHFFNSTSLKIKIGIELEFYLLNRDGSQIFEQKIIQDFIADLRKKISTNSLIYQIEKEQGAGQIEVKSAFNSDLLRICDEIEGVKNVAKNLAAEKNLIASFAAQPFFDDCGSALQFNISLHDFADKNLFESDQKILQKTAQGLLQMTDEMMIFLAPKEEDYARFSFELNRNLFKKGKFTAPVNLSFGADNRSCAIRIPPSVILSAAKDLTSSTLQDKLVRSFAALRMTEEGEATEEDGMIGGITKGKRLEYRIAAADADPALCLSAILLAILFGIENDLEVSEQLHGNAFDQQYNLKTFCQNLSQAQKKFFGEENFIRRFIFQFASYPQH